MSWGMVVGWFGCSLRALLEPRYTSSSHMFSYVVFNYLNNYVAFSRFFLFLSGWSLRTIFLYDVLMSSFVALGLIPTWVCKPTLATSSGKTSTCSTSS